MNPQSGLQQDFLHGQHAEAGAGQQNMQSGEQELGTYGYQAPFGSKGEKPQEISGANQVSGAESQQNYTEQSNGAPGADSKQNFSAQQYHDPGTGLQQSYGNQPQQAPGYRQPYGTFHQQATGAAGQQGDNAGPQYFRPAPERTVPPTGRPYPNRQGPIEPKKPSYGLSNALKVFLTVLFTVIPGFGQLAGIITAIVFMGSEDDEDKRSFGVALLVACIVIFAFACIGCFVAIIAATSARNGFKPFN